MRSAPNPSTSLLFELFILCRADSFVVGSLRQGKLGKWRYKSRTYDAYHEGIMFPMNVTQELGDWPEMHLRERKWVSTRTH